MSNNIDDQILNELRAQKIWWEQHLEKLENDIEQTNNELAKVNRLIEVYEERSK
jgi:hypothetical protein